MGLLGSLFGGSKQSSTATQTQNADSFGYSANRAGSSSTSGATSSGFSRALSGSKGREGSSQGVFAGDIIKQLFQGASSAAGAIDPALATERNNQLFTGGSDIIARLSGGGAGGDYLERRLAGEGSDVLDAQIGAIGNDLGKFLNEQLNPVITGSSVAGGALGGGRQGVAQAGATDSVLREFATQAGNLRAADLASRDASALGLMSAQNANAQTALGSLGQLSDLGSGLEGLEPFAALSQIIGGPTTLTESFGETESFGQEMSQQQSEEFAQSLAEELGISYDEAHQIVTSSSTSKGKSNGGIIPGLASLGGLFG